MATFAASARREIAIIHVTSGASLGEIVVSGSPEDVARCARSYTGRYLRSYLSL